jgi:hypothetical protein
MKCYTVEMQCALSAYEQQSPKDTLNSQTYRPSLLRDGSNCPPVASHGHVAISGHVQHVPDT